MPGMMISTDGMTLAVHLLFTVVASDRAAATASKSTTPIPATLMFPLAVSNFKYKHNYA